MTVSQPNTITLFLSNDGWLARYSDPEVVTLFGSDTLPTAFTAQAPSDVVLRELQRMNPDSCVRVATGGNDAIRGA